MGLDYPIPSQSVKTKSEVANQMSLLGLKYSLKETLVVKVQKTFESKNWTEKIPLLSHILENISFLD